MKVWKLILLLLVLAAVLAIGAGVSMLHNGLSAHATPTAMEAMLARNARHLAIPANARNEHNPVTPSDQNLQEAMAGCRNLPPHTALQWRLAPTFRVPHSLRFSFLQRVRV